MADNTENTEMNGESLNISEQRQKELKQLFPGVFTETKNDQGEIVETIDFERLKAELGEFSEIYDNRRERYGMDWPGKRACLRLIQEPSRAALKPCREESVDFDTTENLFIEGDNLEVLKLLQKSYYGKVKMIYIDPPYNTGKEFIYPDNFSESLDTYLEYAGLKDSEGKKFSTNTANEGRFHTKWLNMMYPRLYLARNLLKEDGVIFISIDDNEVENLRRMCDEIFGEENFVESITWNKRIPKNDKGIGNIHEYILIYVKNSNINHEFKVNKEGISELDDLLNKLKRKKVPLVEAEAEIKKLYKKKGFDRGITLYNSLNKEYRLWGKINMSWPNANTFGPDYEVLHPKTKKAVKVPDRGWRWKKETFEEAALIKNGEFTLVEDLPDGSCICGSIWFAKDECTQPSSITFLDEVKTFLLRSVISTKSDGGVEVEKIFGEKGYFSYPKPTKLLKTFIESVQCDDGLYVDFFAGTASFPHAVIQANKDDLGSRKFIAIQLPEPIDTNTQKNRFSNIADLSKERLRRVLADFQNELDCENNSAFGFKVLKLDVSNIKRWRMPEKDISNEDLVQQMELSVDHIEPNVVQEDLLYELLIKSGIMPTEKVEQIEIVGHQVFSVADGTLLVHLEGNIDQSLIDAVLDKAPSQFICLDKAFHGNDQLKANAVKTFEAFNQGKEKIDSIDFKTV